MTTRQTAVALITKTVAVKHSSPGPAVTTSRFWRYPLHNSNVSSVKNDRRIGLLPVVKEPLYTPPGGTAAAVASSRSRNVDTLSCRPPRATSFGHMQIAAELSRAGTSCGILVRPLSAATAAAGRWLGPAACLRISDGLFCRSAFGTASDTVKERPKTSEIGGRVGRTAASVGRERRGVAAGCGGHVGAAKGRGVGGHPRDPNIGAAAARPGASRSPQGSRSQSVVAAFNQKLVHAASKQEVAALVLGAKEASLSPYNSATALSRLDRLRSDRSPTAASPEHFQELLEAALARLEARLLKAMVAGEIASATPRVVASGLNSLSRLGRQATAGALARALQEQIASPPGLADFNPQDLSNTISVRKFS